MILRQLAFLLFFIIVTRCSGFPSKSHRGSHGRPIPPAARHQPQFNKNYNHEEVVKQIKAWKPEHPQNVWELSGLFEGDIMLAHDELTPKNGLKDPVTRWPGGIVPYYIEEEDFDQEEIDVIKKAIKEYHEKTCLRFRHYNESDSDYVRIESKSSGCWSMVGRRGKGQILNLNNGGCVRHGVVIHELMHALGFYHQQSAANRDEWVVIHWDNIQDGKESNFIKYDKDVVTDYDFPYDYGSIMHYSSHAFSKNQEATITPKKEGVKIGQRITFSETDLAKLQAMYKDECNSRKGEKDSDSDEDISFLWTLD